MMIPISIAIRGMKAATQSLPTASGRMAARHRLKELRKEQKKGVSYVEQG